MVKKYIVDTCIWRDFYQNRFSKSGNPLGKYATGFFMKILKNKDIILFSEALIWELKKHYSETEIDHMLMLLVVSRVLFRIKIARSEDLEARKLSIERKIPYTDCLNAVQARNQGAFLVSQDKHILVSLADIAQTVRPQDIN